MGSMKNFKSRVNQLILKISAIALVFRKKTVIGIDVGTDSVKTVILTRRSKKLKIAASSIRKIEHEKENLDIEKAIRDSVEDAMKQAKEIQGFFIGNMPTSKVILRNIELPFNDAKKIYKVIKYEIESKIPFAIEDIVVDFCLGGTLQKKREILVCVAKNDAIQKRIRLFNSAGFDP